MMVEPPIEKIVSGGQTGADRAALDYAKAFEPYDHTKEENPEALRRAPGADRRGEGGGAEAPDVRLRQQPARPKTSA